MMPLFDHHAVRRHRARAAARLAAVTPVLDDLGARLLDRLDDMTTTFKIALDLGGRGGIAPVLKARGVTVISADAAAALARKSGGVPVAMEAAALPFGPASFDLILASCSLHFIDDLPGALIQLRRALKPGGLFLASMPVTGTLADVRAALLAAELALTGEVNPRISPYPDLADCAGLLQRAGFSAPVADVQTIDFAYANPLALLYDLRAAGETSATLARSRRIPPRALFAAALSRLPLRDGRVIVPLRLAVMTGWAS